MVHDKLYIHTLPLLTYVMRRRKVLEDNNSNAR